MAVDKRIPRVLNSDSDSKTIDKVSMRDALNVYAGPDNEGFSGGKKSDAGNQILKNIRGNTEIFAHDGEDLPNDARVIGFVEDVKTDITYLFVYSAEGSNHGIWAYDKNDILNTFSGGVQQAPSVRLIYKSAQFNFPQNGFVKADVVYTNSLSSLGSLGVEFDKDVLLYFTDGANEPRKINTYRAFVQSSGSEIYGDDIYAEADFITACPKTPLNPITFEFNASQDQSRTSNNFINTRGFQFAYQYVYIDGMETAISPYSDIAFPRSVLEQGAAGYINHSEFNECQLTVPLPGAEIDSVRILCRQGNTGSFLVIDQVEAEGFDGLYKFYNDKVLSGVSTDEVNKQFDSVPRKAVSQTASSNRLFYGNYLDGFNNVDVEVDTPEVVYHAREEDFISFDVKFLPSITPNEGHVEGEPIRGKTTAFVLDCTELPNTMSAGTVINALVTLSPDQNWHVYKFPNEAADDIGSFHQSNQIGPQEQDSINNNFDGANTPSFTVSQEESVTGAIHSFGLNDGVGGSVNWNGAGSTSSESIIYGTSALNPLILKGAGITFSAKIRATDLVENARIKVNQAIRKCFTEEDEDLDLSNDNFELVERSYRPSYSYTLGLTDGDLIPQSFLNKNEPSSPFSKLLVAVNSPDNLFEGSAYDRKKPYGAFIVNSATPTFRAFKGSDEYIFGDPEKSHIGVTLESIEDVEVHTCVHEIPVSSTPYFSDVAASSWVVITKETLEDPSFLLDNFLSDNGLDADLRLVEPASTSDFGETIAYNQLSYLSPLEPDDFFVKGTDNEICLFDGEGGPGGGPAKNAIDSTRPYDTMFLYNQGSITVNPFAYKDSNNQTRFSYGETFYFQGEARVTIPQSDNAEEAGGDSSGGNAKNLPLAEDDGVNGIGVEYLSPQHDDQDFSILSSDSVNFKRLHSYTEILSGFASILPPYGEDVKSSFKTEASHDFGIVYYDERGRHGFVNPIESVYVEGYSKAERLASGLEGRVSIKFKIISNPPDWAHFYKFVYAKNTSVEDFVQYNSGGAFLAANEEQSQDVSNTNIYVSLNYLQGHPISYVSSFGARTPEGGLNFYKFEPGDKLRVISYSNGSLREYPRNLDFEVVDFVKLGVESNPLSNVPEQNQMGDFVVIKNNPNAGGFNFQDVSSGTSEWGNNCIIELRTPMKELDDAQRLYYEIGPTGSVESSVLDGLKHVPAEVELSQGDVWFRRVAVNVRDLEDGLYPDLIIGDDGNDDPAQSNFKNVYLETNAATDLYRADSISIGRPNVILEGAKETIRENTITYSDPSNPESTKVSYSSFNPSLANFKDLSEKHGGIHYMSDYSDYVVVIQKEKITIVPVNKNILSDASGSQQIVASTRVLNEAIVYPGMSGCDDDPSSVYDSGKEIYFCNKSLSKVYRWTKSGGPEEISEKNMSSVIRAAIKRAQSAGQLRVVGGFDPLKSEYLFTLDNPSVLETQNAVEVVQPSFDDDSGFEDESFENSDLTNAINDFYQDTEYTNEDMSAQLAIQYLKDLVNAPIEDQPTGSDIKELLSAAHAPSMYRLVLDTYGDNNDSVGDTTESQDFLNVLGPNGVLGDTFDPAISIFQDNEDNPDVDFLLPPTTSVLPLFDSTQDAVDYLVAAGNMSVWNYYQWFNENTLSDIRHQWNVDNNSTLQITDFLVFLASFSDSFMGYDSAFDASYTPTIENPEFTANQVMGFIQQQSVSGIDPMTAAQYYQLAQNMRTSIRLNFTSYLDIAAAGVQTNEDGENILFQITTADLLMLLGSWEFGPTGESGVWTWNPEDPIFQY